MAKKTRNMKLGVVVLLIPLIGLVGVLYMIFGGGLSHQLAEKGVHRIQTQNWEAADSAFQSVIPTYGQKFAYYKVKENQTLAVLSAKFGVPEAKLTELNPGAIVLGTVIKVPPVEKPFEPEPATTKNLRQVTITDQDQVLHIRNDFKLNRVVTNIPELATLLQPYKALENVGNGVWRLNRAISLDENIRLDILGTQVSQLELRSSPNNDITCLCFEDSDVLIQGTKITSFDPATSGPDTNPLDGRSFVRALKSTRMDVIGATISYLGNELQPADTKAPIQKDGGTYGISWRIPDGALGMELVTGWVEDTDFHHNHYGSYTFGASGMTWRGNHFHENEIYGLDPHDDSNNALVENNLFDHNGKHGFIVSKRCNYNVIRNNRSIDNKLHGYMLHLASNYNVIENNYAEGNVDNYVIYNSDYNAIRNNVGLDASGSHVRINESAVNNFVLDNTLTGGRRGVYIYGNSRNTYIKGNTINTRREVLSTSGASGVMLSGNTINSLSLKLASGDKVIFGPNTIQDRPKQ